MPERSFAKNAQDDASVAPASLTPRRPALLYFDHGAGVGELLLDGLGLFLGDAFLHVLGRSIHQFLGFFQAEAGDFADSLDYIDLIGADFLQEDGELGLLLGWSRGRPCGNARRTHD